MPLVRAKILDRLRALGIPEDAAVRMAESDASGRSPQLVRNLLLHHVWVNIVDPDGAWLDDFRGPEPGEAALAALIAAGADRHALTQLVRAAQFEALCAFVCALDDGHDRDSGARWAIFELDEAGAPARAVLDLHESITGADPTGEADGWL